MHRCPTLTSRLGRFTLLLISLIIAHPPARAADLPVYLWFEPEWFDGVEGFTEYHSGAERLARVNGHWGIAGPGVSAEWTQGGESEWNSMAAGPNETAAVCERRIFIPRAGRYRVWVRYYDHRGQEEPFTVRIEQGDAPAIEGELGVTPVVPPNDEYMLYWGFSFGWGSTGGDLALGPATLKLVINRTSTTWRQVDAVLITDDMNYRPVGREKPRFAWFDVADLRPTVTTPWRGSAQGLVVGEVWKRPPLAKRDFTMWTTINTWSNYKWWDEQSSVEPITVRDAIHATAAPEDIREEFLKQYAGRQDVPLVGWPGLIPGFGLHTPNLSPESNLRRWLESKHTPFFILANNAEAQWNEQTGPAAWDALNGPLAEQFLGFIAGESLGTEGVRFPDKPLGATRREHIDALGPYIMNKQAEMWTRMFRRPVPPEFTAKNISCLSVESITMAHLWHQLGAKVVGWETDGTNIHTPMRIAFARGAARQYGANWINYASGNFGDACNYFAQDPIVPRGAKSWFHSKYAVTDGVPITWYRSLYYLNYLSGASAIFWEQGLANQWLKPGPDNHPVQLSPFGRATEDFQGFVDRLPDRGEPYTPMAVLLSYGHGYEPIQYTCKMLHAFRYDINDVELRELFNVMWYPIPIDEGRPATPMVQNLASGAHGNIYDVLVDRTDRLSALRSYPVVWAAGDVRLGGDNLPAIRDYVEKGGTLVVNTQAARDKWPEDLLGVRYLNDRIRGEVWRPADGSEQPCPTYHFERVELAGAAPLAFGPGDMPIITRHVVGQGAVITTLIPHNVGYDERAHPSVPYLLNGLTADLLPMQVLNTTTRRRPAGEVMYQINRIPTGWLVALFNNRGIDKTQNGIARVDRTAAADITVRIAAPITAAREWTQPRPLPIQSNEGGHEVAVQIPPGDVQVIELTVR